MSYDICLWLAYFTWYDHFQVIHIATNGIISFFLWLSSIPVCVCVCVTSSLSIHLSMGTLSCFPILVTVNSAAMKKGCVDLSEL